MDGQRPPRLDARERTSHFRIPVRFQTRLVKNRWNWSEKCEDAFEESKKALLTNDVLVPYDVNKKLVLAMDASPTGVGAVLSHEVDGVERPVAFASRTLTKSERNYSQIDKEGLGIVYGIRKFHKYLYGRKFHLLTDHQPLVTIFGPKTGVPTLAAARMQRWVIILSAYTFTVSYCRSADKRH